MLRLDARERGILSLSGFKGGLPVMSPCSHAARKTVGLCLAGVLLLTLRATSVGAVELVGIPRMLDGDTVLIGGVTVRLKGTDAPEKRQLCLDAKGQRWACGIEARNRLIERSADWSWTCSVSGGAGWNRSLGSCHVAGEDIQRWMVRSGLALSYKRFSRAYDADERAAREARAGLWSGTFIEPWNWRDRNTSTEILGAVSVPNPSGQQSPGTFMSWGNPG